MLCSCQPVDAWRVGLGAETVRARLCANLAFRVFGKILKTDLALYVQQAVGIVILKDVLFVKMAIDLIDSSERVRNASLVVCRR